MWVRALAWCIDQLVSLCVRVCLSLFRTLAVTSAGNISRFWLAWNGRARNNVDMPIAFPIWLTIWSAFTSRTFKDSSCRYNKQEAVFSAYFSISLIVINWGSSKFSSCQIIGMSVTLVLPVNSPHWVIRCLTLSLIMRLNHMGERDACCNASASASAIGCLGGLFCNNRHFI